MSLASAIFLLVVAFCLGILAGRAQVAHLADQWRDSAVMWEKIANRWKERVLSEHDN